MTTEGHRVSVTREIVLPLGLVLALAAQCVYFGRWSGRQEADALHTQALAATAAAQATEAASKQIATDAALLYLTKDTNRLDKELRLLRDYTEGRISGMPYRPPGGFQ
jgi:hypothetical protein